MSDVTQIERAIRAIGGRVTPVRVRVLGLLQAAREPISHAEIEATLSHETLPHVDRVTLYRVLDWLAEAGLAHKAADGRGVFRFSAAEPTGEHSAHVHFRCTDCGGVFCIDAPRPAPPKLPRGFHLSAMDVDLRGECARCARGHR